MSEDMIWQILDEQFCSFKAKFEGKAFCKNEYNLTGLCNKMYCPLANGRYATIREEDGVLYLHIKTIERAHSPANLWEKIALPEDMGRALAIINENLAFWPRRFVNKVKERLVRLHQYIIRYRKWYYRAKPRLVTVHKKFERREQRRELKSLVAAKLDTQILKELQDRFDQGVYDQFINLNNKAYMELLREAKRRELKANGRRKIKTEDKKPQKTTPATEVDADAEKEHEAEFTSQTKFVADEGEDGEDGLDIEDWGKEEEIEYDQEYENNEAQSQQEDEGDDSDGGDDDDDDEEDDEIRRLKKRLVMHRKRQLELKQKQEHKKNKRLRRPVVEIEYEEENAQHASQSV
jgi:protein MAK16